jgi:hypothetical protein
LYSRIDCELAVTDREEEKVADEKLNIFVSCGTAHNETQATFIRCLEEHLKSHNCIPQTIGRNVYSVKQPVEAVRKAISQCHGAVVVALERTRIKSAVERPGSDKETKVSDESHPTIWNHIEAGMAYARGVPLLIFAEKRLRRQGMLSDRLEWRVIETEMSPGQLQTEDFRETFKEWLSLVAENKSKVPAAQKISSKLSVKELASMLGNLEAAAAWRLCVAIFTAIAAVAAAAYAVGRFTAANHDATKAMMDGLVKHIVRLMSP